GDAVLFQVAMGRMPYEYYHSLLVLAPSAPAPVVLYPHHADQITFLDFVEKPDLNQLAKSLPQYPRVWLVLSYAETPAGPDPTSKSLVSLIAASHPAQQDRRIPTPLSGGRAGSCTPWRRHNRDAVAAPWSSR